MHCNDSRDEFDSGADRHANFGNGTIDPDLLAAVVRDAAAPVVCETPGGVDEHAADFAWLREPSVAAPADGQWFGFGRPPQHVRPRAATHLCGSATSAGPTSTVRSRTSVRSGRSGRLRTSRSGRRLSWPLKTRNWNPWSPCSSGTRWPGRSSTCQRLSPSPRRRNRQLQPGPGRQRTTAPDCGSDIT